MLFKNITKSIKFKWISIIITTLLIIIPFLSNTTISESAYRDEHIQFSIWQYENNNVQPSKPLVLELSQKQWQASVAAAMTPAFINRYDAVPLLFDDGSENNELSIPHDTKSVSSFGTDQSSASGEIATTYWSQAELVVVADTYEHVLWAVPIASFLSAPILIEPNSSTLTGLGTKCAIVIILMFK